MSLPEPPTHLRLFYALDLPADVRARAYDHIKHLRERAPQVKATWEREDKLHLTLKFIGETNAEWLPHLIEAAVRAAAHVSSFEVLLEGTSVFPSTRNPRILWLGIKDPQGPLRRPHKP